jgi:thiamine biosynthesis lipoprotein
MIALAMVAATLAGRHEFHEIHMGVQVRVVLHAESADQAAAAARIAFDRVRAWDDALSDWRPDTPAQNLPSRAGETQRVEGALRRALEASRRLGQRTAGGFEAGLGSLTRLWRDARRTGNMPQDNAITAALACSGRQAWDWNPAESLFIARRDGVRMDFGAIGQGLAADDALSALREAGFPQALVDVSGDIAIGDAPPGEPGWRIEIAPATDGRQPETLTLHDTAISTSGDAAQATNVSGGVVGHLIDPASGRPLPSPRQATVIASDAATADAVATALCTLPMREAMMVAKDATIAARIDRCPEEGGIRELGRWPELRRASSGPAGGSTAPEARHPSPAPAASDPPGSPPRPST